MKPTSIIHRLVILLITLMSAIGANAAEAYACYTSGNTTLTFYYDNQRNSRPGTTYDLNTGSNNPVWDTNGTSGNVTKVVFDSSFAGATPTSTYSWFYNMVNLESITGLNYLNTSEVTNMAWMFGYCYKLTTLDLSSFNTSKVTTMEGLFYECLKLQTIYVGSGWTTNGVTNSEDMFYNCIELVGSWNTTYDASHVDKTYARIDWVKTPGYFTASNEEMPYACYTPENTTLTFYFDDQRRSRDNQGHTTYILNKGENTPGWGTDDIRSNVTKVVFDSSFAGEIPTTTCSWFYGMTKLQTLENMNYLNTSKVTNMAWMFAYSSNLTSLDLSSFDTSNVTTMEGMFSDCVNLKIINMSSFNTSMVTDMRWMFIRCSKLQTVYVGSNWSTAEGLTSTSMFYECSKLKGGKGTTYNANYVDATYARIDGGTSSKGYFTAGNEAYACYTSSNTTLTFYYDKLRSTRSGTTYDLYTGNTGVNTPEWWYFFTYENVTKVVFNSSFAEARPTSTYGWFNTMTNLEYIEGISYLNTSEVINMDGMFAYCNNLTSLDLSHFNTAKVTTMQSMFSNCTSLQTIYVGDGWSTDEVSIYNSSGMFGGCTHLKGGMGTIWNSSNPTDKTYAHIDGGTSNPGYFTYKKPSGIATGIENVQRDAVKGQRDEWYTLDGRKLSGEPTKKGVYIQNGQKRIIK